MFEITHIIDAQILWGVNIRGHIDTHPVNQGQYKPGKKNDHPASTNNASTSSTVFSNIYNLTIHL